MKAGIITFIVVIVIVAVLTAVLMRMSTKRRAPASPAPPAAVGPHDDATTHGDPEAPPTQRVVGFGPQTSSLPILTPDMLAASQRQPVENTGTDPAVDADAESTDPGFGNRGFGFFGAVTSAISITPQVGRDGNRIVRGRGPSAGPRDYTGRDGT